MRLGLVGLGYWGRNYLKTLEKINDAQWGWVCSPNKKNPEDLPKDCRFTNDYDSLLEDYETKGIVVSTPPSTHYELVKSALQAGKDVLVEKPMTLSSEEALELRVLSEKKSQILMVGHLFLYHPAIVELKRRIEGKELGDLLYFYSRRTGGSPIRTDISAMWNLAPHDISIMNYLLGQTPKNVSAEAAPPLRNGIEDAVDLILEYDRGIKGFVHVSWLEPIKRRETTVIGKGKTAIFEDTSKYKLTIFNSVNPKDFYYPILDDRSPLELQCLHFLDCIASREKPLTDGYEGYQNVRILEYAQQSLETGQRVLINL